MELRAALLEVERLVKRYGKGAPANDGIDLDVAAGEVFGLLGPNGAGKSTLVGQLVGLLQPTSGAIHIAGVDVVADPAQARRLCTYQPQGSVPIEGLTPLQAVALAGRIRGGVRDTVRRRAADLLERLDLGEWAQRRTQLSGGVARLVGFCMAAVVPGRVVILDEPTNDVDPLRRRLLWAQVRELADAGQAILLVTHNVLEAERCVDRLAILDHGRVVARGTPASLRAELGSALRIEVVVEPGRAAPAPPSWLRNPLLSSGRLIAQVSVDDVGRAVDWADAARRAGDVAEFLVAPGSLEDVYARAVGDARVAAVTEEHAHAALAG